MWNVYDQTIEQAPRTNNHVEGWHRGFCGLLASHHPTIWKFVDGLKKEQSLNQMKIEQFIAGHQPAARRKRYREAAMRLQTIALDFTNRSRMDYLRGIAHNIELQV
jgi:hypothetical protein